MDVLLLSCGTGGGHNAAARAIAEELRRRGHGAEMLNPYSLCSEELAGRIDRTYIRNVQKAPRLFGAVYRLGEWYRKLPLRSPVYLANRLMAPVMAEYLEQNRFDLIITTHIFPAGILTAVRRSGVETPKVIHVATDYVCIPFTEESECDAYVIPSAELTDEFAGYGIPREKLCPLGIPVSSAFAGGESRREARARLGLCGSGKYILVSGGSMGGGSIKSAIQALATAAAGRGDTELIVVCGSNSQLYGELEARQLPNTTLLGFTDDMAGYMRACDLFVTKPGGLSSTEAAVCGVPLAHTAAIPGCETFNAGYFSSRGLSLLCPSTADGLLPALDLLDAPRERAAMVCRQSELINPCAAGDICDLAERMAGLSGAINARRAVVAC